VFATVQSSSKGLGKSSQIRGRNTSTRGGFVHIIKKLPSSGYLPLLSGNEPTVQFGIDTSIAIPTPNEDHVTVCRDLWSMEQELSKSNKVQECNKCIIMLSKIKKRAKVHKFGVVKVVPRAI